MLTSEVGTVAVAPVPHFLIDASSDLVPELLKSAWKFSEGYILSMHKLCLLYYKLIIYHDYKFCVIQVIQVGAARLLSMLFFVADHSQLYISGNACFGLSDKQVHVIMSLLLNSLATRLLELIVV